MARSWPATQPSMRSCPIAYRLRPQGLLLHPLPGTITCTHSTLCDKQSLRLLNLRDCVMRYQQQRFALSYMHNA